MDLVGWFSLDPHFTIVKQWFGRIQAPQNQCNSTKTYAKQGPKIYSELNENGTKTEPNSEPQIINISKNTG